METASDFDETPLADNVDDETEKPRTDPGGDIIFGNVSFTELFFKTCQKFNILPSNVAIAVLVTVFLSMLFVVEAIRYQRCPSSVAIFVYSSLTDWAVFNLENEPLSANQFEPLQNGCVIRGHYLSRICFVRTKEQLNDPAEYVVVTDFSFHNTNDFLSLIFGRANSYTIRPTADAWRPVPDNPNFFVFNITHLDRTGNSPAGLGAISPSLNAPNDFLFLWRAFGYFPLLIFIFSIAFLEDIRHVAVGTSRKLFAANVLLTFLLTAIAVTLLCFLLHYSYEPDINAICQKALETYFSVGEPHPMQMLQYVVSLLLLPVFSLGFLAFIYPKTSRLTALGVNRLYGATVAITALFLLYLLLEMGYVPYFRFSFLLPTGIFAFINLVVFFPIILYLLFSQKHLLSRIFYITTLCCGSIVLLHLYFIRIYNAQTVYNGQMAPEMQHFTVVIHAMVQAVMGKTLLVDQVAQYGCYAHFFEPILRMTGTGLLPLSILLSLLTVISYVLGFISIRLIAKDKFVQIFGFLFLLFFSYFITYFNVLHDYLYNPYYHVKPIRFFPAMISIFVMLLYFKKPTKTLFVLTTVLAALMPFWNLDTGVPVLITWLALIVYDGLLTLRSQDKLSVHAALQYKSEYKRLLAFPFLSALGITLTAVFAVCVFLFFHSGQFPNLRKLIYFHEAFVGAGITSRPMRVFDAWNLVHLFNGLAFIYAVYALFEKRNDYHSRALLVLSLIGFGIFPYYQNYPIVENLIHVWHPAILIAVIFIDQLKESLSNATDRNAERTTVGLHHPIFGVLLFFLCVPLIGFGSYSKIMFEHTQEHWTMLRKNDVTPFAQDVAFLRKHCEPGEKVLILINELDAIYYGESQTRCPIPIPSSIEIFRHSEIAAIDDFLKTNQDVKVFANLEKLPCWYGRNPNNPNVGINKSWSDRLVFDYQVIDTSPSGNLQLFQKRK